ncbi:hypothetical protein AB2B38_005330 [Balneola sp. MJW-20]|uniref:hypothetical protein n=1 Tax=Gracilimonas aurantiaca TaxID=3234185 RepID=UPI0034665590
MSFKRTSLLTLIGLILLSFPCVAQNQVPEIDHKVTSYSDAESWEDYKKADLDQYYPDLMSPENRKENFEEVYRSWGEFHQKVYSILKKEGFTWGSDDPQIYVLNKIYFNPEGEVQHYFFRILNDSVSMEKRKKFKAILESNFGELKISYSQTEVFAQCGKSAFPNS